jgi:RimJ/RimL family protein N-acetyltransferase
MPHHQHDPDTRHPNEVPVLLRDGGQAWLRPLEHAETGPVLEVFAGMSSRSRALRYLTGLADLPASMLRLLTDVDGDRHGAWVASVGGEPAGLARFVRTAGCPTTAELAFEVVDRLQGRGLGTVLLDTITTVAAARGVRRVQASIAPSNTPSRILVERLGARTRLVDGLLESEGALRLLDPPAVDRSAVIRLACAGAVGMRDAG